jgi:hypothetical protein
VAVGLLLLFTGFLGGADSEPAKEKDKVTLRVVKYDEFAKIIRDHTGQVLVMDFWGID